MDVMFVAWAALVAGIVLLLLIDLFDDKDPREGFVPRLLARHVPTTRSLVGAHLLVRARGTRDSELPDRSDLGASTMRMPARPITIGSMFVAVIEPTGARAG